MMTCASVFFFADRFRMRSLSCLDVRIMVKAPPCIGSGCVLYGIFLHTPSADEGSCPYFWNIVSVHSEMSGFPLDFVSGQCRRLCVPCYKRSRHDQKELLLRLRQVHASPFVSYRLSLSPLVVSSCCIPFL